jgi:Zn-dependent peptidase ImmA (M78 family)
MASAIPKSLPSFDRRQLALKAMQAATAVRARANLGQHAPICVYAVCEAMGIIVRFNEINMEGMYQRGTPPRIHLSAHRPLARRVYNCAHELGHHVFGHGSSIDELRLRERSTAHAYDDPNEFLADTFAGYLLMPTIGIRRAFSVRSWSPATATAPQLYTVACDFGVGYTTLLTHLSAGLGMLPHGRAAALRRIGLGTLRRHFLGALTPGHLIVADRRRPGPTIDAEVEMRLLLPNGVEVAGQALKHEGDVEDGCVFRAVSPGIAQAHSIDGWAAFIRVAPKDYVGLAQYRHLEEDLDE